MDLNYLGKILKLVEEADLKAKNPPGNWNEAATLSEEENTALALISQSLSVVKQHVYQAKILKGSSGAQVMQWSSTHREMFPAKINIQGATEAYFGLKIDLNDFEVFKKLSAPEQQEIKARLENGFKSNNWTMSEASSLFKCQQFYLHNYPRQLYITLQMKYSKKILSDELMNEYMPMLFNEVLDFLDRSQMR